MSEPSISELHNHCLFWGISVVVLNKPKLKAPLFEMVKQLMPFTFTNNNEVNYNER